MPILPVAPAIVAAPAARLPFASGEDKNTPQGAGAFAANAGLRAGTPAQAEASPASTNDTAAAVEVSLSPAASAAPPAEPTRLAPLYAEIWRDGVRVAEVDIHGQVSSPTGVVGAAGSGLAGPLLAAQRAVQAARQLGGEIRTASGPVDPQTLLMRERLASKYLA